MHFTISSVYGNMPLSDRLGTLGAGERIVSCITHAPSTVNVVNIG